jgi:hypothetical protein
MIWLVCVTFTAGYQKIYNNDPQVGFISQARLLESKIPLLQTEFENAKKTGDTATIANLEKSMELIRL